MAGIILGTQGAEQEADLDLETNALVYQSTKRFSRDSQCEAQTPLSSVLIPREMTEKLAEIQGRFYLNKYKDLYRNINIYTADAESIDGVGRICFVSYDEARNGLKVQEIGNVRNSGYSALYRELEKRLEREGFQSTDGAYFIAAERLEFFVEIVNELIDDKQSGKLELVPVDEIDSMSFISSYKDGAEKKCIRHYYFKAYWLPKKEREEVKKAKRSGEEVISELFDRIEHDLRTCAGYSLANNDINKSVEIDDMIRMIKEKLEVLEKLNANKRAALEELKKF